MTVEEHPIHGRERAVTSPTPWFRLRLWLSDALWFPVFIGNGLAILMGLLLPMLDKNLGSGRRLPLTMESVQSIFSALAGGMITFTGIVFSAIFIAAQIQTASYSPRLAARLRRDPVIMGALVMSSATATYALFALAAIGRSSFVSQDGETVPAATVLVGLFLAVATLGQFSLLVQRAFESIQIGGILRSLARNAWRVIDDVHPHPASGVAVAEPTPPQGGKVQIVHHAGKPGVIAAIDRRALLKLAASCGGCVEVVPPVGEFVGRGSEVLRVHDGRREVQARETLGLFILARQRTIDQDVAFVIRMLVDIAIRGLSPAINDPTTAVQVIDRIEATLIELWHRHPGPTFVSDGATHASAFVHAPSWSDYFELGSSEIRRYGQSSLQIVRRLTAMHEHLLEFVAGSDRRRVELELRLLNEGAERSFPDPDELAIASTPDRLGLGGV